jgi:hypothetical protein
LGQEFVHFLVGRVFFEKSFRLMVIAPQFFMILLYPKVYHDFSFKSTGRQRAQIHRRIKGSIKKRAEMLGRASPRQEWGSREWSRRLGLNAQEALRAPPAASFFPFREVPTVPRLADSDFEVGRSLCSLTLAKSVQEKNAFL